MSSFATIAPYYNKIFPYKPLRGDFIESLLSKNPSYIMDIGCATGAMAIDLASRGHFVTGIDLDTEMISIARRNSRNSGAEFEAMDMLQVDEVFGNSQFHVVSCLGNTLVQLDELRKIKTLLTKVKNILLQGGVFVVQNVNYDKILNHHIKELPLIENMDVVFYRNYCFESDSNLVEFKTKIIDKSTLNEILNSSYLYPLRSEEFKDLIRDCGFASFEFFGDFDGRAFEMDSPAMVAVLRK